ncbi:MAG: alpha/beta hydrolase [Rhodobacteraceae bacterium]|nr:alpha/beta hydrolase [Paracoccaceae bacterium]MCB2138774.1 alpha/beta hydrolase [Paracoccaceae bacterium]MCB2143351.1 alpha/beta hydrolase [Paracoccaceae bacterium]MCB2152783.1 alpha/beta hydrolase [Paracoccaceae bacterium]
MTDYSALIDDETWAFIHRTQASYPDDTVSFTIDDQRRVYDAMCVDFRVPYPPGVGATDRSFAGVACRLYECGDSVATVIYFHGGGFVVGGLESHDDVCAEICAATGCRVVSVDYRLAPEHRHPAAFMDCTAATAAIIAEFGGPVVLAGDSAGANLAAATVHATRGAGFPIVGQVLIYGAFADTIGTTGSYATHANAPLLTREDMIFYRAIRMPEGRPAAGDPTAAPLADADFGGLPPTFLIAAECDPLCDDSPAYAARVTAAGGKARCEIAPGMVHGFLRARHMSGRAAAAFARITDAIAALARGAFPWPEDR